MGSGIILFIPNTNRRGGFCLLFYFLFLANYNIHEKDYFLKKRRFSNIKKLNNGLEKANTDYQSQFRIAPVMPSRFNPKTADIAIWF